VEQVHVPGEKTFYFRSSSICTGYLNAGHNQESLCKKSDKGGEIRSSQKKVGKRRINQGGHKGQTLSSS